VQRLHITYISTAEGWLYLAVVFAFYSRKVLGYAFSDSLKSTIVCDAFVRAVGRYGFPEKAVYHSDRVMSVHIGDVSSATTKY